MKAFAQLYEALDATTSTLAKVRAMAEYFRTADPADAAWALYFLTGRRIKRFIAPSRLKQWLLDATELPDWLYEDAYAAIGDTAETVALLLDTHRAQQPVESSEADTSLSVWMTERLLPLQPLAEETQKIMVLGWYETLTTREIFLLNKLLMGGFRVGVSQNLVLRALSDVSGLPTASLAHRMMGTWEPTPGFYESLMGPDAPDMVISRPYPFYLASPLEGEPEGLGDPAQWLMEWKWDGIRAQLIKRGGQVYLWSRGEELITERFPEIAQAGAGLPDGTVLDGEVLAWANERPLPFQVLQQRIGRLKLTAKILSEAPVVFQAYDLLELAGQDTRPWPLIDRRTSLTELISNPFASPSLLRLSPRVEGPDWESLRTLLCESRQRGVEGLMIKRLSSPYQTGRKRGDWWKWKIEPFTVDVVMIYAQAGRGRRANLHTDYTFAVWNAGELVPIAKAYSGLSDAEINQLDRWIRAHTLERFGPVRSVEPQQVFELAFEGIAASSRHKSKIALRFPRIARWRTDKPAVEANTLQDLEALLRAQSPSA